MPKSLLVAGGRSNHLNKEGFAFLKNLHDKHKFINLINGMAKGIDQDAREYFSKLGLCIIKVPANWDELGKQAGPVRNKVMASKLSVGDVVVILPGGRGSDNMFECARQTPASVYDLRSRLDLIK